MNCVSIFFCWCIRLIPNSAYLPDGQAGVKSVLLREVCLKAVHRWMKGGSNVSKCARTRSKKYETLRTSADFSGEDFQNTGTFIVVKSTVFSKSSALVSPLARDAYNALWNSQRTSQVRNYSLLSGHRRWSKGTLSSAWHHRPHRRRALILTFQGWKL